MPTPGAPKASKKAWVWDRPSYRIPATAKATRARLARSRSASSNPEANRRTARRSGRSALGSVRQGQRGEAADEPEPDREDLAVASPGGPPVLGHRDEGEDRVAEHDQPERLPAASRRHGQLQPDEDGQADRRRPSSETGRIGRRLGRRSARARGARRQAADGACRTGRGTPRPGRRRRRSWPDRPSRRPTGRARRRRPRNGRPGRPPGPRPRPSRSARWQRGRSRSGRRRGSSGTSPAPGTVGPGLPVARGRGRTTRRPRRPRRRGRRRAGSARRTARSAGGPLTIAGAARATSRPAPVMAAARPTRAGRRGTAGRLTIGESTPPPRQRVRRSSPWRMSPSYDQGSPARPLGSTRTGMAGTSRPVEASEPCSTLTRSRTRVHGPAVAGAARWSLRWAVVPGASSAGSVAAGRIRPGATQRIDDHRLRPGGGLARRVGGRRGRTPIDRADVRHRDLDRDRLADRALGGDLDRPAGGVGPDDPDLDRGEPPAHRPRRALGQAQAQPVASRDRRAQGSPRRSHAGSTGRRPRRSPPRPARPDRRPPTAIVSTTARDIDARPAGRRVDDGLPRPDEALGRRGGEAEADLERDADPERRAGHGGPAEDRRRGPRRRCR